MNSLKNLTPMQWVGIVLLANGVITGSVNEMTDLIGAVWAKHLVSLASMGSGFCGGLVTMFGGQAAIIKQVAAMPGIEPIKVNAAANHTLASIAMDPSVDKVEALPTAQAQVARTANS